ncbi:unnamed protein product [Peronospora farinosa]|uniref:Retroviral polymerase SH3-like domain-containing protein n=1 Tax=Peronospora farinosa TaxID=134698 RepID=A0ABN8C7M8_9STRA|nr:unnamed protein product [Peronospora farinosa]
MARSMTFASDLPLYFDGDAVGADEASPRLCDIVVFGLTCTVYRYPKKHSLAHREQVGTIVGRSDETKGYRVFICKDNIVMVMQHVKNIQTFPDTQNAQPEDHDDNSRGDARIAHGNFSDDDKKKKGKGRGKRWTRAPLWHTWSNVALDGRDNACN